MTNAVTKTIYGNLAARILFEYAYASSDKSYPSFEKMERWWLETLCVLTGADPDAIEKAAENIRYLNNDTLPGHGGRGIKSLGNFLGDRKGSPSFSSSKIGERG